jgi:membrane fusion protein (multidrug efflux system)
MPTTDLWPGPLPGPQRMAPRRMAPLLLAPLLLSACQPAPAPTAAARAAPEVGVVTVATGDAPLALALPGRLAASQVAQIRPQVTGVVQKRLFTEGAQVAAGQAMYQLDDAAFVAERNRAAAALAKAEAQVAATRVRAQRDAELLREQAVSRQAADDSAAALRQAEADVAVAQAALEAAQVQLARTRITAPIAGHAELSTVSAGALVTAAQATPLTTVQQLDPMHVDIVQSSAELLSLRRQLGAEGPAAGAAPKRTLQIVLEDGSLHPHPATLAVSGLTVDPGTGAVTLRATVPNPQRTLLPGMVVTARLVAGVDSGVVLVPQQGVSRNATGGATALVVGEGNKAELRRLALGRAVGNQWLVADGLKPGDRLIVEGLQRVRPGQAVTPVPAGKAAPAAAAASAASAARKG